MQNRPSKRVHGRGAAKNPPNRFEPIRFEPDPEGTVEQEVSPKTQFFRDVSRNIISRNDSPDIPYEISLNPYRGCEHGCAYCYARPTHEYLGWSCGLDFETKIVVKPDAAKLLRETLSDPKWEPRPLTLSGVTDPYQPAERHFRITRACLEVLAEFRHPVCIVTKNHTVTRDLDLLQELARYQAVLVEISITTLDTDLASRLEPRTSRPALRLQAIETLASRGIPVGVLVAPIIPGLTDHEIPAILQAAAKAGACWAGWSVLRLPYAVKEIFLDWLRTHYPLRFDRVVHRIQEMRGGQLTDYRFGTRLSGEGPAAERLVQWFDICRRRAGFREPPPPPSVAHFRSPAPRQLELFPQLPPCRNPRKPRLPYLGRLPEK